MGLLRSTQTCALWFALVGTCGIPACPAQYFGLSVEGGMREVLLDRPLSKVEEHYTDHALWKLPVGMSGQYGRLGLLLDGSSISRVVSFNWSGAVSFERLDGKFRFASNELPYSGEQEDHGFRRLDVIRLESALGIKVRLFKGLVVRLGALLSTPVYGAQRTIWTRVITDENGLRYEHDLDESTEASDDLYYGSFGDGIVPAGYAELAYEFKRGVGLQIRGTSSLERPSSIRGRSGSFSVGWSTYAVGAGFTFRLVPSVMPRSNWGGVKPMSTEEVRELRRARKATNAPVQDTMQMVQPPSAAPGPLPPQAGVDAPLPVSSKDTGVAMADTALSEPVGSIPVEVEGSRYVNTPPAPGELRRITLLNRFSTTTALDTFRIVTTADEPRRHFLEIIGAEGARLYKAEVFTVDPLETAKGSSMDATAWEATLLRDMLGPWAFSKPMPQDVYEAFLDRDRRGLRFTVTEEQVEAILLDPKAVAFRFAPEPGVERLLAVDRRTGAVVNLAPLPLD